MALLHLDYVRVRSADVTHKYRVTSLPVCTECVGFACGSFLWGLQNSWPLCGYKKSLLPLKREDLPLCIYSLVLHLDIAAFLLQCCGSFGMEHVNLCTVKKARIKNAFLTFGSYQDSNISVICSLWPYVLLSACRVPQGCFFCWCERNDGMILNFFFFIALLINSLEEGSVPNVAMLAAATREELNTTESWIILRIVFSLGMDNLLTDFCGEKCEGTRPEANTARGDYAVVHMEVWGTIHSCCWSVGINFRSHVQIAWSIQWFSPRMDLCVSAS